jgi:hypothetical protein
MPVFGIVPYRTEARTRSEARIQAEVDRLLLILKTVNEVIRTAEGRLIELFRPPPFPDDLGRYPVPHRAPDRRFRIEVWPRPLWGVVQQADGSYRWDEDYERNRTTSWHMSWGTIQ